MAGIYNINWKNVGQNLMFWRWRTNRFVAYIDSIMTSVQTLSDELNDLDDETIDFLQYTGQHKVLEELLNDKYDEVQRRIYITENNIGGVDPVVMYLTGETPTEEVEIYLTGETPTVPVVMYLAGEAIAAYHFTVNIPVSVTYVESTLRAQIGNYKLAGKEFDIVIF